MPSGAVNTPAACCPAYQCPGQGRRFKGASGVALDRFATLDQATAPQGFGACEETGNNQ
jgi:hypothetical protein